jgi:flagellar basal body-associated protein FliL
MKIFIQARKDGYNVLYPIPTPTEFYQFASDIQSASARNNSVYYGKNFYTLAFVSDGCIFTKYEIGYDIQRQNLGNIGISVFIPNTQKLSGSDIKILLDDLINTYHKHYCSDNNISDKREDWTLFTTYADKYDAKLNKISPNNADNVQTGTKDPAFIYYKNDSDLQEYFEKPYQEEYSDYKQIFFVDSNLQDKLENPLNVLRHSENDLTGKIDLKNEYYYLNNYDRSKGVIITANGKQRSNVKGNNQIRAKWQIVIKYSKDERCYLPIEARGTLNNQNSDIYKYLEVRNNQVHIRYDAFANPVPKEKSIRFEIRDRKGNPVSNAEIQIGTQPWQKVNGYQHDHTFEGEELKERWTVSVKKDNNLYSKPQSISLDTQNVVPLVLKEHKTVKIIARYRDRGDVIRNCVVYLNGSLYNNYKNTNEIEFVDDDIYKDYIIKIIYNDYKSESKKFCPAKDGTEINFELEKQSKPHLQNSGNNFGENESHDSKKSWKNKHKSKVIASLVVATIVLSLGIWALCFWLGTDKSTQSTNIAKQIKQYVEGIYLNKDTLDSFMKVWEKQNPKSKKESDSWLSIFGFGGSKIAIDDYKKVSESIGKAKTKRELIDSADFAKLKRLDYSKEQEKFKTTIGKMIDSVKYEYVKKQLGDVSALTLNQIADSINVILKKIETPEVPKQKTNEKKKETLNPKPIEKENDSHKKNTTSPVQQTPDSSITAAIIQYLKEDKLEKAQLEKYKEQITDPKLEKSIDLALRFWKYFEKDTMSFDDFYNSSTKKGLLKDVENDPCLKESKLYELLKQVCENNDSFQKFQSIPGRKTKKSIDKLKKY